MNDEKIIFPGKGISGLFDRLVGPGATIPEILLEISFALSGAIIVPLYSIYSGLGWSWLQLIAASLIAFDIFGGIVTNATSSAKKWYHRDGQGTLQHLSFIAAHIHPLIVSWLFLSMDWGFFIIVYGFLIISATIILALPQNFRRPVAYMLFSIGILIGFYLLPQIPGFEWFVPFFYLKLLISYILK